MYLLQKGRFGINKTPIGKDTPDFINDFTRIEYVFEYGLDEYAMNRLILERYCVRIGDEVDRLAGIDVEAHAAYRMIGVKRLSSLPDRTPAYYEHKWRWIDLLERSAKGRDVATGLRLGGRQETLDRPGHTFTTMALDCTRAIVCEHHIPDNRATGIH